MWFVETKQNASQTNFGIYMHIERDLDLPFALGDLLQRSGQSELSLRQKTSSIIVVPQLASHIKQQK